MDEVIKAMCDIMLAHNDTENALKIQNYWSSFDEDQKTFIKCVYEYGKFEVKEKLFKALL